MSKHQWSNIAFGLLTLAVIIAHFYWNVSLWFWIIIAAVWLIFVIYGSFAIRANYHLQAQSKLNTQEKIVALTFDDGPTTFTTSILDLLKKEKAKATFFCIGQQIEKHPEIFKRIIEEGHAVGNHTYTHQKNMGFKSKKELVEEIHKTNEIIKHFGSISTQLFRPPFGVTNPNFRKATAHTKMRVIGWSIRSLDTLKQDEETILNRITTKLSKGSIILMHDTSQKTVHAVARLLEFIKENGYKTIALGANNI
jgi:peptidoglycan/xylan/chitin deacetylase (PgdA/CDA1 family)